MTLEDTTSNRVPDDIYRPVGWIGLGSDAERNEARPIRADRFRLSPYRADSMVDSFVAGPFAVVGATVRGDAHRLYGVPRQDEMTMTWLSESSLLVVAVADGVSSAALSHFGALTACRYATEYFIRQPTASPPDWNDMLHGCAWAVIEAAQRLLGLPAPDPIRAEESLATTLTVVAVSAGPTGCDGHAVAVGDSAVAFLRDGALVPLLGGKAPATDGITSTGVFPLPRVPHEPACAQWRLEPNDVLLVGTDGIWDAVGDGTGRVARFLSAALGDGIPERVDFLRIVDFCRETFDDDRTLVAIRHQGTLTAP